MLEDSVSEMELRYRILCHCLWKEICDHVETRENSRIKRYFYPDDITVEPWIPNPFLCVQYEYLAKGQIFNIMTKNLIRVFV
jgi:hypothetical protein